MEQERSLETSASPEAIWKIWSDPPSWPTWNPLVKAMTLEGPFAIGTSGDMTTPQGKHRVTLAELQPGSGFAFDGPLMPGCIMTFRCKIAPSGSGSRISQGVSMKGPLAGLFFPLMGKSMADRFIVVLQALAAKAEGG
jgi:hypothetical protein